MSHRVEVRKRGAWWTWWCENDMNDFTDDFPSLIHAANDHARHGDHEDRWCACCYRYRPTCDDRCLECGGMT